MPSRPRGFGARRAKGTHVPHDLYGVNPSEVEAYRTWTGFSFSLLVYVIVALACGYVIWEYMTIPYDLAEAIILYDPEVEVGPEGQPMMPDIGIRFTLKDRTPLSNPDILDIRFYQETIYGNGSCLECRESFRIPNEKCAFLSQSHEEDAVAADARTINATCPMWGTILTSLDNNTGLEVKEFEPSSNGTRMNATVPKIQGNFMDDVYSFVKADVLLNITGLTLLGPNISVFMDDIYGGSLLVVAATYPHELSDTTIHDVIFQGYKVWERGIEIKEYYMTKMDVPFGLRTIEQGHYVVDFDFLAVEYQDIVSEKAEVELDDTEYIPTIYKLWNVTGTIPNITKPDGTTAPFEIPEAIKVAEIFFRISRQSHQIKMIPPSTLFDLLGIVGGFISLFSLMIGWPAVLINSLQFRHALKIAKKKGEIPEGYLEPDGSVRFDKTNEVVRVLNNVDVEGALLVGGMRQLGKTCAGKNVARRGKGRKGVGTREGPGPSPASSSEVHPVSSDGESV